MPPKTMKSLDGNHPMAKMMDNLLDGYENVCRQTGISHWDFCVMLANVQAHVLAGAKDAPVDHLLECADDLHDLTKALIRSERGVTRSPKPSCSSRFLRRLDQ